MRVLLLTSEMNNVFSPQGGAFNLPRVHALQKKGYDVVIINSIGLTPPLKYFFPYPKISSILNFFKKIKYIDISSVANGIQVFYSKWIWLPKKWFWYREVDFLHFFSGRTISKIIEDFKPYVVIASWLHPFGTYAKYIKKKFNIPVIAVSEGSDLLVFPKKYRGIRHIYKDYLKFVDKLIFVSERQKKDTFDSFPFEKSTIILNGYDEELFVNENKFQKEEDKTRLISVGSLLPVKGHDILLKALTFLDERFHLLLVGDGPEKSKYIRFINENRIRERVNLTGEVDHQMVKKLLPKSDIYCQPSRSEGFPIAVMEAMACGLPVVASNVGGLPELIKVGFNGYLFHSESVNDLVRKIKMAAQKDWDHEGIANWTRNNYGWNKWAERMHQIILEVTSDYKNKKKNCIIDKTAFT